MKPQKGTKFTKLENGMQQNHNGMGDALGLIIVD